MKTPMQKMKWLNLLWIATLTSSFGAGGKEAELQLKKFRFNRHSKLRFERLVLEFASNTPTKEVPTIRLLPDSLGKYTTVKISKAALVGAIPESNINDSFTKASQYFGPVSINTDTTSGFEIKTFLKQSHTIVDAFWLEKPSRLIVDVFPKDSDRALGPNVVTSAIASAEKTTPPTEVTKIKTASDTKPGVRNLSSAAIPEDEKVVDKPVASLENSATDKNKPEWSKAEKPEDELVLCFPAHAQVRAKISFEKGTNRLGFNVPQSVDSTYSSATAPAPDSIVCYPKGSQVTMTLKFQPNTNAFYGRVELDGNGTPPNTNSRQPSSYPPFYPGYNNYPPVAPPGAENYGGYGNGYYPPAGVPPFRSPQSNLSGNPLFSQEAADLALALPDENGTGGRSMTGGVPRNAPLSLGKKLVLPSNSANEKDR